MQILLLLLLLFSFNTRFYYTHTQRQQIIIVGQESSRTARCAYATQRTVTERQNRKYCHPASTHCTRHPTPEADYKGLTGRS